MSVATKVRNQLRERSQGFCERCGMARATNVHHRKNRSQLGGNELSNLLHLCGSGTTGCHGFITANPKLSYENGWSVKSHDDPATIPVMYRGFLVRLDDLGNMWEAA